MEAAYIALGGKDLVATVDGTVTTVNLEVGDELGSGGVDGTAADRLGQRVGQLGRQPRAERAVADRRLDERADPVVSTGSYEIDLSVDSTEIDSIEVGQTRDDHRSGVVDARTTSSARRRVPRRRSDVQQRRCSDVHVRSDAPVRGADAAATATTAADDGETDAGPIVATDAATATGTVTEVDEIADASSGVATYSVTVSFDDDSGDFFIGTSVVADITTSERADVVQLPIDAVTIGTDGATVTVAIDGDLDGATEQRTVETARRRAR